MHSKTIFKFQTRIVGGTNTGAHEFPYQAVLVDEFGSVQCGATISE